MTVFCVSAIALISKYVTKGWKEVQTAYSDKEKSEEVAKVLSYLEVVEKVKHSCDETEVVNLIEEHKLEREQLLTDHLKSKQVSVCRAEQVHHPLWHNDYLKEGHWISYHSGTEGKEVDVLKAEETS